MEPEVGESGDDERHAEDDAEQQRCRFGEPEDEDARENRDGAFDRRRVQPERLNPGRELALRVANLFGLAHDHRPC